MNRATIIGLVFVLLVMVGCANDQSPVEPLETAVFIPTLTTSALPINENGLDLVLQGGGAKGLAYIGAIRALEEDGQSYRRVVGTSAGSVVALLLAAGFTADEMQAVMTERLPDGDLIAGSFLVPPDLSEFSEEQLQNSVSYLVLRDAVPDFMTDADEIQMETLTKLLQRPHFREFFALVETGGMYSSEPYMAWLRTVLDANGRLLGDATFAEFHAATGADLTIIAADKTDSIVLMLNHRTAPDLPVVAAVRMSSSIPFVFQEVVWQSEWGDYLGEDMTGHLVIDGGATTNLPLEMVLSNDATVLAAMALEPNPEQVLALVLDQDSLIGGVTASPSPTPALASDALENALIAERWQEIRDRNIDLMDTLLNGRDRLLANAYPDRVCRLPVQGVRTLEYGMSEEKLGLMLSAAQAAMEDCLVNLRE